MILLTGDCFNALYLKALKIAISNLNYQDSRSGRVINLGQAFFEIMPDDPRMIFLNHRKFNPVFAIIEGAWVLSGNNRLKPLLDELPNFEDYSDDGETLNGAYGNRLRHFFGFDQINAAIESLQNDSLTRRIVMTMYSPSDLKSNSFDIPCNTSVYIKLNAGAVDITVLNRSNDLYLGIPYNIFVFGLLQSYFAWKLGLRIGIQRHFTDGLHLYVKNINQTRKIVNSNILEASSVVSNKFDWKYAIAILENIDEISLNNYDAISNADLAAFLKRYNRESRLQKEASEAYVFSNDFYGFLAYQCYPTVGHKIDNNEYCEKLRRMMMSGEIKQIFEQLSMSSGQEIAQNIIELSTKLKGKLPVLRKVIDKKPGPFGFKDYGNEELALRVLLLCLVWTTLDEYTVNTPIGAQQMKEIATAALLLNVPESELAPLCLYENELFSAISSLLRP